jgi:hypothetical protein
VIAAGQARDDAGRHRRRAAAEHQAIFRAFEYGDLLAQDFDGRIVAARVDVLAEFVAEAGAHRVDRRERKDRRLHDRRRDGAEILRAIFAELVEDVTEIHQSINCGSP